MAAGFELRSGQPQTFREDVVHQRRLLFLGVIGATFEVQARVVAVNRPRAHSEAELDVGLDFPGVGCAVEQPELNRSLGEKSVEIDCVMSSST